MLGAADRVAGAFVGVAQARADPLARGRAAGGRPDAAPDRGGPDLEGPASARRRPPAPTDFALELGRVLDATGLPAVFVGFEPIPAAPVDRPDDPTAAAIAKAALASVVKVSAAACGYTSSGTGFAVADEYVVTNAHVVAGAIRRSIRVATDAGKLYDAEAVLFDPELDVAVLHVDGLGARGLRFAAKDPARGALGASIGYPGGGGRVILPAAVAGAYPAVGRDIYDQSRVERDILELRAEVDRGDSGGPLILKDGTVGGVVFAESRTDDQVGLRPRADPGRGPHRARHRPDRPRRHRGLHPLIGPLTTASAGVSSAISVGDVARIAACGWTHSSSRERPRFWS